MSKQISPEEARSALDQGCCFVDIRDPMSFQSARIRSAIPLTMQNLDQFLADVSTDTPLVVYCYHGHSSIDACGFLADKGYQDVASLQGGFEYWRQQYPDTVDS